MQRYSGTIAFKKLRKKPNLQTTKVKLTAYGGVRIPIKGTCTMKIKHNDKMIDVKFFVVAVEKAQPLIGLQTCRDIELISINNNVSAVIAKETEILDKYQDVFAGLGLVHREFHIELHDDAKPTIHPPRKIPLSLMPKLQNFHRNWHEQLLLAQETRWRIVPSLHVQHTLWKV